MGRRTSKTPLQVEIDDEFHLADTEEVEQLKDLDTDVLEALGSDEGSDSGNGPGRDPYNNSKIK